MDPDIPCLLSSLNRAVRYGDSRCRDTVHTAHLPGAGPAPLSQQVLPPIPSRRLLLLSFNTPCLTARRRTRRTRGLLSLADCRSGKPHEEFSWKQTHYIHPWTGDAAAPPTRRCTQARCTSPKHRQGRAVSGEPALLTHQTRHAESLPVAMRCAALCTREALSE